MDEKYDRCPGKLLFVLFDPPVNILQESKDVIQNNFDTQF